MSFAAGRLAARRWWWWRRVRSFDRARGRPVLLSAGAKLLSERHRWAARWRAARSARSPGRCSADARHRGEGALIGAGVGAITGNVLGRAQDQADERRAANGAAVAANMNQQAAAPAVTNYDLVGMARAGVSDDLIISTIQSRGARLDLSPQGLIALKQSGVSDRVVLAAQNMGAGPGYVAARPTYVAAADDRIRHTGPTALLVRPAALLARLLSSPLVGDGRKASALPIF